MIPLLNKMFSKYVKGPMLTPRENLNLFGHQETKDFFLKAFHSPRFSHAWVLGGPYGIGKATFAHSMARYILAGRQDSNTTFTENDPLYRRIVAQSHGDLWTIESENEREISVDLIREMNSFLTQTPREGGWRVVLIDGAENLNHNAANALLKRLEEPPPKTVFLLTTPLPERLLATVRSRCQFLAFAPLQDDDVYNVLHSQKLSLPPFASLAQGSPGRLIRLMEGEGVPLMEELQKVLKGDNPTALIHQAGENETSYHLIEDLLRTFLYTDLMAKVEDPIKTKVALNIYEKVTHLFDQCRSAQLDRRATLACVLGELNP